MPLSLLPCWLWQCTTLYGCQIARDVVSGNSDTSLMEKKWQRIYKMCVYIPVYISGIHHILPGVSTWCFKDKHLTFLTCAGFAPCFLLATFIENMSSWKKLIRWRWAVCPEPLCRLQGVMMWPQMQYYCLSCQVFPSEPALRLRVTVTAGVRGRRGIQADRKCDSLSSNTCPPKQQPKPWLTVEYLLKFREEMALTVLNARYQSASHFQLYVSNFSKSVPSAELPHCFFHAKVTKPLMQHPAATAIRQTDTGSLIEAESSSRQSAG